MSLNLLGILAQSYQDRPVNLATSIGHASKRGGTYTCLFSINWIKYVQSASNDVYLQLNVGAAPQPIDLIKSIYVDNLGNPLSVIIVLPDTGQELVIPPNAIKTFTVITTSLQPIIVCQGAALATYLNTALQTRVLVSNALLPESDAGLPQPSYITLSSGIVQQSCVPDQSAQGVCFFNPTTPASIISSPTNAAYIVVSNITTYVANFPSGASGAYKFRLYHNLGGSITPIRDFYFTAPSNLNSASYPVETVTGLQLRFPAQVTISIGQISGNAAIGQGAFVCNLDYNLAVK